MSLVAANGILVLTPYAPALHMLASSGSFGTTDYVVQGIALIAGPVNMVLMGQKIRDGMVLRGRLRKKPPA